MSNSYILTSYPVPSSVQTYAHALVQDFSAPHQLFFLHLLASNLINLQRNRFRNVDAWVGCEVPLPCETIDKHFGTQFSWHLLHTAGLIDVSEYSPARHECKTFAVGRDVLEYICFEFELSTAQASKQPLVNLFDGQPYVPKPPQYRDEDSGQVSLKWVRDAAGLIASCPFNGDALDQHLANLKAQSEDRSLSQEAHCTALHRYYNDRACAQRIKFGCSNVGGGFFEYRPSYRAQYSGRLSETGGGLQSCSREMKRAVFADVAGVRNYDLKASQAFALLQELEDAGLERRWLVEYLDEPNGALRRGDELSVTKDTFKTCLYATIMGAHFTKYTDPAANAIYQALLDETRDESMADKVMTHVHTTLAPLKESVDAWHDWLMSSPSCPHVIPKRRARTLRNACEMEFRLDSEGKTEERKRRAAAFILQGREAAYVHRLTLLSRQHGFTPISNQHDGLVTLGEIPREPQEQAMRLSGFRLARLEEKAFL